MEFDIVNTPTYRRRRPDAGAIAAACALLALILSLFACGSTSAASPLTSVGAGIVLELEVPLHAPHGARADFAATSEASGAGGAVQGDAGPAVMRLRFAAAPAASGEVEEAEGAGWLVWTLAAAGVVALIALAYAIITGRATLAELRALAHADDA